MDTHREEILNNSLKTIEVLSEYSAYFKTISLTKIYLHTRVVHMFFVDNEDIDINKLELFHVQFTDTLTALLQKVKSKNERIVKMYKNEITVNTEMIEKLRAQIVDPNSFDGQKSSQTQRVSKSLRNLYTAIYNRDTNYFFKEDLSSFSIEHYKENFFEGNVDILNKLLEYDRASVYRTHSASVEKMLLVELGKANFQILFWAGIQFRNIMAEVYQINNTEQYFIFIPSRNLFLPIDITIFPSDEWERKMKGKEHTIRVLIKNNLKAETNIKNTMQYLSHEIQDVLNENYEKISSLDFFASLEDISIETNTLRAMLETKMI